MAVPGRIDAPGARAHALIKNGARLVKTWKIFWRNLNSCYRNARSRRIKAGRAGFAG